MVIIETFDQTNIVMKAKMQQRSETHGETKTELEQEGRARRTVFDFFSKKAVTT